MKNETSAKAKAKAKALADGVEVWCSFDKLVPVGDLKPNPRNPNTHPSRQVALLTICASIQSLEAGTRLELERPCIFGRFVHINFLNFF